MDADNKMFTKGDKRTVRPSNLYTALIMIGVYVKQEDIGDKDTWESPEGNVTYTFKDGELYIQPVKSLKEIDFNFYYEEEGKS